MKQPIHRLAAAVALFAAASVASLPAATIVLGANDLLGTVFPGTPNNETNGLGQVTFFVNAYNAGGLHGANLGDNPNDPNNGGVESNTLYRPVGAPALLVAPVTSGLNVAGPSPVVDLAGFSYEYILFSQASKTWIYYIGDISGADDIQWGGDPVANPAPNVNGSQISHYLLFNKTTTPRPRENPVPDGGTTVVLVGAGLLVTAFAARRKKVA
jgi:hypothetical protein